MSGYPGFGVLLTRLLDHRKLDIVRLSRLARVGESELQAVVDGMRPDPSLLRRLAPALDLHVADLLVIADMAVPDELAPLDVTAGTRVPKLVEHALELSLEYRRQLSGFVRSLPQASRTQPVPPPRLYAQYEPGSGALLLGMLGNRNLYWQGTAHVMALMTGGRVYLSAATIGYVGRGLMEPTPDLLSALATVLGIRVDDLAALIGVELPGAGLPPNPAGADVAELIWDVRRLTSDQTRQVCETAESMRRM